MDHDIAIAYNKLYQNHLGDTCHSCKTFQTVMSSSISSQERYFKLLIHTFHEEHTEMNQLLSKEITKLKLKKDVEENALATANTKLKTEAEKIMKLEKEAEEIKTYNGALLLILISGFVYSVIRNR